MKNIYKNIITTLFVLTYASLMFVAGVNAQTVIKLNQSITLYQTCNNCTYCAVSVMYPNTTLFVNNVSMLQSGNLFNLSIDSSNITALGTYNWFHVCGNSDGIIDTGTPNPSTFDVTSSGYNINTSQSIIIFFIFGVIIIISLLFFFFGLGIKMPAIKLFFLSMTVLLMIFLIGYIINISNIVLGEFPSLIGGFNTLYILFVALISVGAIGLIIDLIAYSLQAFYKTRGFKD